LARHPPCGIGFTMCQRPIPQWATLFLKISEVHPDTVHQSQISICEYSGELDSPNDSV
jgi:hypothetical protein